MTCAIRNSTVHARWTFTRDSTGWSGASHIHLPGLLYRQRAYALEPRVSLEVVPGADHAYASYLAQQTFAERIFRFLFD